MAKFLSLEICAGGGGQALGLELAGFAHAALVEIDADACQTLRTNRPKWRVIQSDVTSFLGSTVKGVDLVAGGVPCPPFSKAGKQLGSGDERDMFPQALRLVDECRPKAVMLENVRGLLDATFTDYRNSIDSQLHKMGYIPEWRLLHASNFGVPQLRPRVILVAIRKEFATGYSWPVPRTEVPLTVGETLHDLMSERGWKKAGEWRNHANSIAPTIVGGSKKHGGPDLGPTRAKKAWAALGVNGRLIANEAPEPDFLGMPHLTVPMVARIQGFSDKTESPYKWTFWGKKTSAYRQVGNAFPPPVARAVAKQIRLCLESNRPLQIRKVRDLGSRQPALLNI